MAFPVVYSASWLILETSGELFIIVFTRESGNVLEVLSAMMKALQLERRKQNPPKHPQAPEKSEQTRKIIKKYFLLFYEVFSVFMTFCSIILGRIFCVTAFLYARVVLPFGFLLFHSQHIYFGVGPSFLNFRSTVCCLFACLCFLVNCQQ